MYRPLRTSTWLATAACALLLGACVTTGDMPTRDTPGYWSSVEDVGANPPPRSDLEPGAEEFYPYVQTPRMDYGRGFDAFIGYGYGYNPYYDPWGAGFMGAFGYDPFFYRFDPFYPGIFVPVPIVTRPPAPRPAPPPVTRPTPPPVSHPPPAPRPPPASRPPPRLPPSVSAPAEPPATSRTRMQDKSAHPKPD
jgi:hypothetical protein